MTRYATDNRPTLGAAVQIEHDPYEHRREYGRIIRRGKVTVTVEYADGGREKVPYEDLTAVDLIYIHDTKHAGTSTNGNPKYALTVSETPGGVRFTLVTQTDGSVGYDVDNHRPGWNEGPRPVAVRRTKAGRVYDLRALPDDR